MHFGSWYFCSLPFTHICMANIGRKHYNNIRNKRFVTLKTKKSRHTNVIMTYCTHTDLTSSAANYSTTTSGEQLGCPKDRFDWCETLSSMNVYIYYFAFTIVVGVAWPLVNITFYTDFANALPYQSQQHQQNLNYTLGQAARLFIPIFIGYEAALCGVRARMHTSCSLQLFLYGVGPTSSLGNSSCVSRHCDRVLVCVLSAYGAA